jgi:hypothetical protein
MSRSGGGLLVRTLYTVALLALCLTAFAACAADQDPVGLSALPTDPGMALQEAPTRCCADDDAGCTVDGFCESEFEQGRR